MINRDCGAAVPEPGALAEPTRPCSTRARSLLETVRNHMEDQAFHLALETIWRVVAEANRYVDEQAPWALRRSDPARMRTVLYTLAETIRHLAILAQPFVPAAPASCSTNSRCRRVARFRRARRGAAGPGDAIAKARGHLSALCRSAGGMSGGEGRAAMLVDSHCHLDFADFAAEREAVIARARAAGVGTMLTIGTRLDEFPGVRAIAESDPDIWCSVGAHPHEAADHADLLPDQLAALAAHPKVVGIGETGLDFHYDLSPRDIQERVFRAHIAASRATGLPLIIHAREADDEIARILDEERPPPGVLHCFSSGRALAEAALALGFYISISGIVTFKNADELRAIVRDLPLDRLLVETDSPYLAPVPYRGKRNEPAFVAATAAAVAALKGVEPERLAAATTANFFRLFAKARPPVA